MEDGNEGIQRKESLDMSEGSVARYMNSMSRGDSLYIDFRSWGCAECGLIPLEFNSDTEDWSRDRFCSYHSEKLDRPHKIFYSRKSPTTEVTNSEMIFLEHSELRGYPTWIYLCGSLTLFLLTFTPHIQRQLSSNSDWTMSWWRIKQFHKFLNFRQSILRRFCPQPLSLLPADIPDFQKHKKILGPRRRISNTAANVPWSFPNAKGVRLSIHWPSRRIWPKVINYFEPRIARIIYCLRPIGRLLQDGTENPGIRNRFERNWFSGKWSQMQIRTVDERIGTMTVIATILEIMNEFVTTKDLSPEYWKRDTILTKVPRTEARDTEYHISVRLSQIISNAVGTPFGFRSSIIIDRQLTRVHVVPPWELTKSIEVKTKNDWRPNNIDKVDAIPMKISVTLICVNRHSHDRYNHDKIPYLITPVKLSTPARRPVVAPDNQPPLQAHLLYQSSIRL